MRDPALSEPNSTFPTYQVPQASAIRGRAPQVQVAGAARGDRAEPLGTPTALEMGTKSVIKDGSSCPISGNSNVRMMQSVTDTCLLNSVTVPKIQRNDHSTVAHNNYINNIDDTNNIHSDKLGFKFGALIRHNYYCGQDIPNKKSDNLEGDPTGLNLINKYFIRFKDYSNSNNYCYDKTDAAGPSYTLDRLIQLSLRTRELERQGFTLPALKLCGGGESSLSTGTSGWGTPPSQQASNNNGKPYTQKPEMNQRFQTIQDGSIRTFLVERSEDL